VAHYVKACRGAGSVLELGSGYGRLLCALAEPERALFGLDWDPGLMRSCREALAELPEQSRRGVRLVRADMRSFELRRRFERVILPYNALYCLLSVRDVERCFRSVYAALEPGGVFTFDVWNADGLVAKELTAETEDEELPRIEHRGKVWRVVERCQRAPGPQRLDVTYTYVPSGRGAARSQLLRQRYYGSLQLLALLDKCGFEVLSRHGGFGGRRFAPRSTRLVVSASRRD
jgi:SAM-dependent methyltransferase